ncbi:Bacterial extracellular solute-binding protein, family 3 [compost metagenome]
MKFKNLLHSILITLLLASSLQAKALCNRIFLVGRNTDSVDRSKEGVNLVSIDIIKEIQRRTDCVYSEKNISFSRAAEELRHNRIDIFAFAFSNPEWGIFSQHVPVYGVSRLLLVDKKHYKQDLKVTDYLSNPKIKFGSLSGGSFFFQGDELEQLKKEERVVFDSFPDGLIELLMRGKLQAVFTSPIFLSRFKKQYNVEEKAAIIVDPSIKLELSIFFSKKRVSEKEIQIFTKAIESMKKDGTLKKIILKYVPQEDFDKFYSL